MKQHVKDYIHYLLWLVVFVVSVFL